MDKKLREYISNVLTENQCNRLDALDDALTSETASKEYVLQRLDSYRDALVARIMFTNWEDSLMSSPPKMV